MTNARRQDLTVFRRDPMRLTISVRGLDLTGSVPTLAVRLYPDQAGAALLTLGPTATPGADGCRIVEAVADADGVSTTLFEISASKAAISALPAAAEPGGAAVLAYDFQWNPPGEGPGLTAVETTVLFGDFIVMGSVND